MNSHIFHYRSATGLWLARIELAASLEAAWAQARQYAMGATAIRYVGKLACELGEYAQRDLERHYSPAN